MQSRAARLVLASMAWIAIGATALFIVRIEQRISSAAAANRAFDVHARETADALAELRAAQQAYVAAGQGVPFWVAKVATTTDTIKSRLTTLRESASAEATHAALDTVSAKLVEFASVDGRALDYINRGETLMAGDVIFAEGGGAGAVAARAVESARVAELQAGDAAQASMRRLEASIIAGAGALLAILATMLAPIRAEPELFADVRRPARLLPVDDEVETARLVPAPVREPAPAPPPQAPQATILKGAAGLATDFGRARDLSDLKELLARAAEMMDASGLMVWVGSCDGADLHPVVSHGYTPQTIARMPSVPRSGDNAAAAAYRTATLQTVASRPGGSGAIVAPLLTPDGCIGSLSVEIRSGGEGSETIQALATIIAAHLSGIFAVVGASDQAAQPKAANL